MTAGRGITTTTQLRLAKRMARLGTETAFEVLLRARALEAQGRDIIHLEIGEPDFDTPANVVEAGVKALKGGWTHYTPSGGMPASARICGLTTTMYAMVTNVVRPPSISWRGEV